MQQRPDCLSSVAVCKYNFISVPCSGGEKQNKMFHFYSLFLHLSLHDFPLSPINVVITVLFIVLCYLRGVVGFFFLVPRGGKIEGLYIFFLSQILVQQCHMQSDFTSKILYSNPDIGVCSPVCGLVCMQVHMLAIRWNSSFPFNFNVKGMLQATRFMGSWCSE